MLSPESFEEVFEILSYMDKATVMKIPEKILNCINKRRNIHFKSQIDKTDIFNVSNISKEAIDLLCYIDYNYWMNKDTKNEVNKILTEKEQTKREKYNPENVFGKVKTSIDKSEFTNTNELASYREPLLKRIWNTILSKFKK